MKLTTLYTVTIILLVFLTIQGWLVNQKFIASNSVQVVNAALVGKTAEVRSPEAVQIVSVWAKDGEEVSQGDRLFTVRGKGSFTISAPIDGTISNITGIAGTFAQAGEKLADLVDTSENTLYVKATIAVEPEDLQDVRPGLLGIVEAKFINDGEPVEMVVTSVDPVYDSNSRSVNVRLDFRKPLGEVEGITTGLPVKLSFKSDRGFFNSIGSFFSTAKANP
jgi:multidrug resistance efflux pump